MNKQIRQNVRPTITQPLQDFSPTVRSLHIRGPHLDSFPSSACRVYTSARIDFPFTRDINRMGRDLLNLGH
jgi:hypothetical protein